MNTFEKLVFDVFILKQEKNVRKKKRTEEKRKKGMKEKRKKGRE